MQAVHYAIEGIPELLRREFWRPPVARLSKRAYISAFPFRVTALPPPMTPNCLQGNMDLIPQSSPESPAGCVIALY